MEITVKVPSEITKDQVVQSLNEKIKNQEKEIKSLRTQLSKLQGESHSWEQAYQKKLEKVSEEKKHLEREKKAWQDERGKMLLFREDFQNLLRKHDIVNNDYLERT